MKNGSKILLMAIVPTVIGAGAILATVYFNAIDLADRQRRLVESALMTSKEAELRSYVRLAQSSLPIYDPRKPGKHREEAIRLLSRLDFGADGYFFVYDNKGRNLMHPRQPELVGKDLIDMRDPYGGTPIRDLVAASNNGGGFVTYFWNKPSSRQTIKKLGYVEPVAPYGWMLGTGLYVDDIDYNVAQLDAEAQAHIRGTLVSVFIVSVVCIVLVSGTGLALNISNHREATERLRELARKVVSSQEEERSRVARELHDGISQLLVSAKLLVETTILTSETTPPPTLGRALDRLNHALREVREISHNLRPAVLDDLGIAVALKSMVSELNQEGGPCIEFSSNSMNVRLTQNAGTALFRICQEALTNARTHSGASRIEVSLHVARRSVTLTVGDNGWGFDAQNRQREKHRGTGLRNMRERVLALDGELLVRSGPHGTQVSAILPLLEEGAAVPAEGTPPVPLQLPEGAPA